MQHEKTETVYCVGELLIDFICEDIDSSLTDGKRFLKKAGGAPANVAAAISKLGGTASFVGKVGSDPFGAFLAETLRKVSVQTDYLLLDPHMPTTLAFVSLKADGERDFVFNRGADERLTLSELPENLLDAVKVLHMGSATALLGGALTDTYFALLEKAAEKGVFVSFDPNFRTDLWRGRTAEFVAQCTRCLPFANLLKVSEEEALLVSQTSTLDAAVQALHALGVGVVAVTLGKQGTRLSTGQADFVVPSVRITSLDSTGAGDAFIGALLKQIAEHPEPATLALAPETLRRMVAFANKVGAITCTRLGAIEALPSYQEVAGWVAE